MLSPEQTESQESRYIQFLETELGYTSSEDLNTKDKLRKCLDWIRGIVQMREQMKSSPWAEEGIGLITYLATLLRR